MNFRGYIFGATGVIERYCGVFGDPEFLAFHGLGKLSDDKNLVDLAKQHLYRVRFCQSDLWDGYDGNSRDTVDVEVYESWLRDADEKSAEEGVEHPPRRGARIADSPIQLERNHISSGAHFHKDHVHMSRLEAEENAVANEGPETPGQRLAVSLCRAAVQEGIVTQPQLFKAMERVDMLLMHL